FFQAEDGIRDFHVTGVQTCALPIFPSNYIGRNSRLEENVVLSKGVHIGNNSSISNIIIGENSFIDSWVGCTGHGNGKISIGTERSEERRVGKECKSRGATYH